MIIKLSPLIPKASGKIGGHSISSTRNGIVMKTIVQPRQRATNSQSKQRSITADITNKWQFLTPDQKLAWNLQAPNYNYLDNLGELATRNGFQTFCFLNQNRRILEQPLLHNPPVFETIVRPIITRDASAEDDLILKGTDLISHYLYAVFVQIHYTVGASNFEQTPLIVARLTAAQLTAGYSLVPDIKNTFATEQRIFRVNVQTVAISSISGNRDLSPSHLVVTIPSLSLGLKVLSYYNFNGNVDDHFNINNAVYVNGLYENNGIINTNIRFSTARDTYASLGDDNSLNFEEDGIVQPFSLCFWFIRYRRGPNFIFGKLNPTAANPGSMYQLYADGTHFEFFIYGATMNDYLHYRGILTPENSGPYFFTFSYMPDKTVRLTANGNLFSLYATSGTYNGLVPGVTPFTLSRNIRSNTYSGTGSWSELVFFNQLVSDETFELIKTANKNGLTILDIM